MTPLQTYCQATLTDKSVFELYEDKLVVKGSFPLSANFERTFELDKLSPDQIKLKIRPSVTWIAMTTCVLTGFAATQLIFNFKIASTIVPGVLGIYCILALIVAIATLKKVEYAKFCSADYIAVLFSIARSGPDASRFDAFVKALIDQIRTATNKSAP
jgi:hypothetical protein